MKQLPFQSGSSHSPAKVLCLSDYFCEAWEQDFDRPGGEASGPGGGSSGNHDHDGNRWCYLESRNLVPQSDATLLDPALSVLANGQLDIVVFFNPESVRHFSCFLSARLQPSRSQGVLDGVRIVPANSETLDELSRPPFGSDLNIVHNCDGSRQIDSQWRPMIDFLQRSPLDNAEVMLCGEPQEIDVSLTAGLEARGAKLTVAPVSQWDVPRARWGSEEHWLHTVERLIRGEFDLCYVDTMAAADRMIRVAHELGDDPVLAQLLQQQMALVVNRRDHSSWNELRLPIDRTIRALTADAARHGILQVIQDFRDNG